MNCSKCGAPNNDNAYKCARCGNILQLRHGVSMPPQQVPNYLVQSILVTLLCCLPLGIPAIVFAASVNGRVQSGNIQGAIAASRKAKAWCWWSFGIGILCVLLWLGTMLSAILVPAVSKALTSAGMVQTVSNGANIYKSVFAGTMDNAVYGGQSLGWPKKGQYRSSTEYFVTLVESGALNVSYDFFAASGITPAKSSDARDFKAENNAWRVVLGLENAPEGTPFMFTRNYNPGTLQSGDGPIILDDTPPFGREGMVVVLKGGAAYSLKGNQLRNSFFNPAETPHSANISIVGP